jgi:hypothetical protein
VRRLGGCSRKPGSGQTVHNVNIPARELGTQPCTRATASSHEGTTRPAEASRNTLRARRSQTTPPRPQGLHPAGALARTHRNETQPRKAGPLAKKCDKILQASINTPPRPTQGLRLDLGLGRQTRPRPRRSLCLAQPRARTDHVTGGAIITLPQANSSYGEQDRRPVWLAPINK